VNAFFFFSDPSLGALWGAIGWAVRLLVGGVSLLWLQRHWSAALPTGRRISVAADSSSDVAGQPGKAATSAEIPYDTLPPTNNVADAGDLCGDGLSDLIVSPPLSDSSEDMDAWRASVVFGKASTASHFSPPADRAAARGAHPA
jgi:hypothetical protein